MNDLKEAVLNKVRQEARDIVRQAEESAARELEKARHERERRVEAEKKRMFNEAETQVARIVAKGSMDARHRVAAAKAAMIDDIVARARESLLKTAGRADSLARLIEEGIAALASSEKVIIGVAAKDLAQARDIVRRSERLSGVVQEVVEKPIDGGVVVENVRGSTVVDNSYAARLEMLISRMLPRLGKELF